MKNQLLLLTALCVVNVKDDNAEHCRQGIQN